MEWLEYNFYSSSSDYNAYAPHTRARTWLSPSESEYINRGGRGGRWKIFFPPPPGKQLISPRDSDPYVPLSNRLCIRNATKNSACFTTNHKPRALYFTIPDNLLVSPGLPQSCYIPEQKGIRRGKILNTRVYARCGCRGG